MQNIDFFINTSLDNHGFQVYTGFEISIIDVYACDVHWYLLLSSFLVACGSYGVRRVWRLGCQGRVENAGSKAPTGPPKWHPKRTRKHQKGVQNDQNGTRNRHQRAQKGQNDPPGARRRIFGVEKEAFSTKGLIVFGAKIDLKSIKKRTKKHCGFRTRFGGSFSRFWRQKWCHNGAEGVPKAIQKRLRVTKAGFRSRPQKQMVSEGKAGFGSSTLKPTALQNL